MASSVLYDIFMTAVPGPLSLPASLLISMVDTPTEVELKLWVAPEDINAVLKSPRFAGSLHDPSRETLDSIYFDAKDRFLRDH